MASCASHTHIFSKCCNSRWTCRGGPQARWPVFLAAAVGVTAMALWAIVAPDNAEATIENVVGQVTTGPVCTTATFIGYILGGPAGAAVATLGIFLRAFIFVALSGVLLPRLRRSPSARTVLDGVNVA